MRGFPINIQSSSIKHDSYVTLIAKRILSKAIINTITSDKRLFLASVSVKLFKEGRSWFILVQNSVKILLMGFVLLG